MNMWGVVLAPIIGLLASMPAGGTYQLKSYEFGSGGADSASSNYRLDSSTGTVSGDSSGGTFRQQSGLIPTQATNVPPAPNFSNPANYYNKLQLTLNTGGNPSDTRYLIAISDDDFTTTRYVQSDNSVASTFDVNDYQTYTAWGGASGFLVLGLSPNTTYKVKVSAWQGRFSESGFGPTASASTVNTTIAFGVETTLSSTPPFEVNFSSLAPGTVFSANSDALLSLTTNADNGGSVYVRSQYAGLFSAAAAYTLPSSTSDLSSSSSGYGMQVIALGQSSGGPLAAQSPFNNGSDLVGGLLTSLQEIINSSGPVTNGSATIRTRARTDFTIPSTNDYTDRHTFIAAMTF